MKRNIINYIPVFLLAFFAGLKGFSQTAYISYPKSTAKQDLFSRVEDSLRKQFEDKNLVTFYMKIKYLILQS